jgi:hypothetical protein
MQPSPPVHRRHHRLDDQPSVELSNALMKHDDINLILATGGRAW